MMPTAYEVAVAIVTACKATGGDPLALAGGIGTGTKGSDASLLPTLRARAYAAAALDRVFNKGTEPCGQIAIARMVGVRGDISSKSFFGNLGPKMGSGWWDHEIYMRVVNAVMDADSPEDEIARASGAIEQEPAPAAPPVPQQRAIAVRAAPVAPEPGSQRGGLLRPRTGLDRFADKFGPSRFEAGGEDQLARRAQERRTARELLAEAAANTARLQADMKERDDG